ncbi:oligosaccharide flippase family protein [Flavobacterium paronense]|uniref:Oligosaccharide flippase family protein n=1 Tax=Flavobacterium paronense TaxID=1392775 RepID=A0ABV5GFG8_9FLAO|nr:oligosaccharide flippase family protein [Flavobacterium paronense]MDN3676046.1 oligosaccharide flippase family protein [Flavobacterium paronense]
MAVKLFKNITSKYGDGILSLAANFIQKAAFLIVTILLARIFGPNLFGKYAFIKQAYDVIIIFILFGGDKSLIYFSAINKNDGLNKLLSVIKFVILIVIVFFLGSIFFRDKLLKDYDFSYNLFFLLIFASTLLINLILTFIESYFIGIKSLKTYFKSVIISALFYVPLSYFFGFKFGIIGVFLAFLVHYLIQFFYIYFKEGRSFENRGVSHIKNDLKQLYIFSFPIGIGELLVTLTAFYTSIILIKNANFEDLGLYNIAMRMVMFIVFIPNLLNNIVLSYISISSNKEKFLLKTVFLNLILSGIVGFVFYVFSKPIFSLFGGYFEENLNKVFINLILGILPFCSSLVLLQYLISIQKRWSYLFFRFLREGLTIGLFSFYIKLKFEGNALLLSKCFLFSNYISLILLTLFIIINYFYERKKSLV